MFKTSSGHELPQSPARHKFHITTELLDSFLYGRQKVERVDAQETTSRKRKGDFHDQEYSRKIESLWCEECCKLIQGECDLHSTFPELTYAIRSFPPEVQLCTSSIPGYKYGACAGIPIPSGTWIGPYEGKRVDACELTENKDNVYFWEIYENGQLSHFVDGSDENISSWMRFIRCARNKNEQSMTVFQYGKNIYYRALRDISVGEEMLVWYDSTYTQFLGIPIALKNEIEEKGTAQDHPVVAQHSGLQGYHGLPQTPQTKQSPVYPPSQIPLTQPPIHVPATQEAPTPFSKEMEQRPAYGQPPHVQPSHVQPSLVQPSHVQQSPVRPPYGQPPNVQPPYVQPSHVRPPYGQPPHVQAPYVQPTHVRPPYGQPPTVQPSHVQPCHVQPPHVQPSHVQPPQVRPLYHVPHSFQAPTPFQLPSSSAVSYHVRSPSFAMTSPPSQASSVSQGTPKPHVPPFSMMSYPPRAGPESQGTPLQIPQVPSIPPSSSPPQLSHAHSSSGVATATPFYRATTDQHQRGPIPSIPPSSSPPQLSHAHSSSGVAIATPFYRATTDQHQRGQIPSIPASSSPPQLSHAHSSHGAATERGFHRATTDQHERGLLEVTTTSSADNQWSSVEVKENMPVNTTEVQHKTSINSQPPMRSSPLENLPASINNATKSALEEKRHNQVSSTVEANGNEDQQVSWKCGQCAENFSQRLTLQMHVCSKAPEKPFQCGHCSLAFANPCELREHVITHSNDRPFRCGFCGRSFAGATTLNNHMRTHTGEKPFVCKTCGKTFAIATQLGRHMKLPGIDCAKHQKDAQWFSQSTPIAVEY